MAKKGDIHFDWDGNLTNYNRLVPLGIAEIMLQAASGRIVREIQAEIRKAGAVDTGALLNSFQSDHSITPLGPSISVYSRLPYANWVDRGTGIYGPTGSPITPNSARMLKFNPGKRNSGSKTPGVGRRKSTNAYGGGGQFTGDVYAASVVGQPGVNFMQKTADRMNISWFVVPF